jgi:hypothetical protein
MDRSPERLLMAAILAHFGDSIEIPIGAVLEAQAMGGYRVTEVRRNPIADWGPSLKVTLVQHPARIEAAE